MNATIQRLIESVGAKTLPGPVVVFGSVARADSGLHSDLDLVVDLRAYRADDLFKTGTALSGVHNLLRLGQAYYGSFDPFLRLQDALLVRNDRSTGWVPAKFAKEILRNVDQEGVLLSVVQDRLTNEAPQATSDTPTA